MTLACEAKLKQLITHALTLTSTSHAITSIAPSSSTTAALHNHHHHHHHFPHKPPVLTSDSFQSLFTISPADLPNKSAAAIRFAISPSSLDDSDNDALLLKNREVRDPRWQIMALLSERSSVRDSLKGNLR
jgi:hypothetical protein